MNYNRVSWKSLPWWNSSITLFQRKVFIVIWSFSTPPASQIFLFLWNSENTILFCLINLLCSMRVSLVEIRNKSEAEMLRRQYDRTGFMIHSDIKLYRNVATGSLVLHQINILSRKGVVTKSLQLKSLQQLQWRDKNLKYFERCFYLTEVKSEST